MVALKYSGIRLGSMSEQDRDLAANRLLAIISLITGWTLPAGNHFVEILVTQFALKLSEKYQNTTQDEFEYAFRNKPLDVKDWGKPLNLSMIDEVMLPYMQDRFDLSRQEEKISSQVPVSQETKQPMSNEEWEEWLLDIAQYQINKIPCDSYNYLERTGKICLTAEQKHKYMERAIAHLSAITDPLTKAGIELSAMRKKGIYSHEVTGTLITISKRLAVFDYFHKTEKKQPATPRKKINKKTEFETNLTAKMEDEGDEHSIPEPENTQG